MAIAIVFLVTVAIGMGVAYYLGYSAGISRTRDRRQTTVDRRTTSLSIHDRRQSSRSFKERKAHDEVLASKVL